MKPVRRVPRGLKDRLLTNSLATTWSWWSNNSLVTAGLAVTGSFFYPFPVILPVLLYYNFRYRGYYTVTRRYFRVAKQYFTNERSE